MVVFSRPSINVSHWHYREEVLVVNYSVINHAAFCGFHFHLKYEPTPNPLTHQFKHKSFYRIRPEFLVYETRHFCLLRHHIRVPQYVNFGPGSVRQMTQANHPSQERGSKRTSASPLGYNRGMSACRRQIAQRKSLQV